MTAAEEVVKLREGLRAYVADLRARPPWSEGALTRISTGEGQRIATEIEARFLKEERKP